MDYSKYRAYKSICLKDRTWPNKSITEAPIWCSVDLRDGNQSLAVPMGSETKLRFFNKLVEMGFKEIEIGFPSASETEFNFLRRLIEGNYIPDDVYVQVLTQSREHLIRKSFEALRGVKKAIVHLYNSTSVQQRKIVFNKSKQEIIDIAVEGASLMVELAKEYPETEWVFQYSPESFPGTELDYALEICEAVLDVWKPTPEHKAIINLPTTVEMATPNVFADQVEWFCRNLSCRDSVVLSVHPHNDRGTGIATAELAVMAGADRIEGTLFGNGERTGNLDILAMALNIYSQGFDPKLEIGNIDEIISLYEDCTGLKVPERHPYAGELVYTAFSGSHQDAISKGMKVFNSGEMKYWDVPYLPIDPADLGRSYEAIIRINSQSGKGGVAYILDTVYGYKLPKLMHPEFSRIVQKHSDNKGTELLPEEIFKLFSDNYLENRRTLILGDYSVQSKDDDTLLSATVIDNGVEKSFTASGNGHISAFFEGLKSIGFDGYNLGTYSEHALEGGAKSKAAAYIEISNAEGSRKFGVGIDTGIVSASMKAILSAIDSLRDM